jgi:hypothetical protein
VNNPGDREILVDERRNIIADVENQPDRNEPDNAVDVSLEKIPKDVTIEQFHFPQFVIESRY